GQGLRHAVHDRQAGHLQLPRVPVADPPAHVPPHEPPQHPRAGLQGGGHHHHAVRHGDAQRHRPLPPRDRRDRPRAVPALHVRRAAPGDGRRPARGPPVHARARGGHPRGPRLGLARRRRDGDRGGRSAVQRRERRCAGHRRRQRVSDTARSIYITSPEGETGKSTIALGVLDLLVRKVQRGGVFRPVTRSAGTEVQYYVLVLLLAHDDVPLPADQAIGVTYEYVHADPEAALSQIVARYHEVASQCDFVVVVGTDYTDVAGPTELSFNARVAANLGAPVLLVVSGKGRTPDAV